MAGRTSSLHLPTEGLTPGQSVPPQSSGAATLNGAGVDLAGKRGAYFQLEAGTLTGLATVAGYLQDSPDNTAFTNVNTTTYPEATLAASNTANSSREMAYSAGAGRQRYVRGVAVVAVNTALVGMNHETY